MKNISAGNYTFNFRQLLLLLITISLFSGCVSAGPKFSEGMFRQDGKSTVYMYRVKKFIGAETLPDILHNGQKVTSNFPVGTYDVYYIEPGRHTFEPKKFGLFKKESVTIENSKPGEVYYLQLKVNIGYIGITRMAPVTALPEIGECYLLGRGAGASSKPALSSQNSSSDALKTDQKQSMDEAAQSSEKPSASKDLDPLFSYLSVNANPPTARIRILNIRPKFAQGIQLSPGRYHIETSAKGYKTDKRWVVLESGEQTINVDLDPKMSMKQQQTKPDNSVSSASPAISEKKVLPRKNGSTVKMSFSPEVKPYVHMLRSNDPLQKRDAAKIIFRSYPNNTNVMRVVNDELLAGFSKNTTDKHYVDAMAWLCKVLGASGQVEYLPTLQKVSSETTSRKLKKYASKNAEALTSL